MLAVGYYVVLGLLALSSFHSAEVSCAEEIDPWDVGIEDQQRLQKLLSFSQLARRTPEPVHVRYFDDSDPFSFQIPWNYNFSSDCEFDLMLVLLNLDEDWARRMIDADAKPPTGIMDGNFMWLGNFYECNKISAPSTKYYDGFDGQYCTFSVTIKIKSISLPLNLGLCVPSTCNETELLRVMDLDHLQNRTAVKALSYVNVTSASVSCKLKTQPWTNGAIAALCIYAVFGIIISIGTSWTVVEMLHSWLNTSNVVPSTPTINYVKIGDEKDNDVPRLFSTEAKTSLLKSFFKCFCLFTNASKILSTEVRGDLQCVHGIRFFSMTWVILGHTYVFAALFVLTGSVEELLEILNNLPFQAIIQGTFSVDSFFLLSGFLLTYLFLKEANKTDGKINWLMFYVHRYIRLTPVYALILAFDVALAVHLGSGPFWPNNTFDAACHGSWWMNLLYINNFGYPEYQCFGWAWYLANDMQFYVISPFLLYPLWRWPKIGLSLISTLMLGSWIASGIISAHFELLPGYVTMTQVTNAGPYQSKMAMYFDKMYIKPYTRIGPYLIGMILGYLIVRHDQQKKNISKAFLIIGWTVATCCGLGVVYGLYNSDPNNNVAAAYNALSRSIFAGSLAWLIYACLTGHGGPVDKILSWKGLIPLSRLTYCAYLVHPIIINSYYLSIKTSWQITHGTMVFLFFGFLVASYSIALACSLAFESSLMSLEKLILKKPKKSN